MPLSELGRDDGTDVKDSLVDHVNQEDLVSFFLSPFCISLNPSLFASVSKTGMLMKKGRIWGTECLDFDTPLFYRLLEDERDYTRNRALGA